MKKIMCLALALMMVLSMVACGAKEEPAAENITGVEDGVLTVGMECAYAPYN
jgi:predicted small lipoprotein YifL